MKYLLARQNTNLLARLADSRVLLAFDFDGTLAPILGARAAAGMRASTRRLFRSVCELYPCAVISGRSRADVRARLEDARVKYIVGNHGLEPSRHLARFARSTRTAAKELARALGAARGLEIEDKRYSLAVHYRAAPDKARARDAIQAAVSQLARPMRIVPGKQVVNLVPDGAPHKGDALDALRSRERAQAALYVGDDITDEDVFELDQPRRLFSVRIGRSRRSAADYFLRDQRDIDRLLARLEALRTGARP